ncbi:MAG: membrane or secreted protein [Bacteroidota bacterium]
MDHIKNRIAITLFTCLGLLLLVNTGNAQTKTKPLTYVDKEGRLRWTKGNDEVYLFGVNYAVPFAYGYRSVKALNLEIEKEIDADVYHLSRMGVDAFRVHIWDTEITDTVGNLLKNDHLKMFDYLVYKLKQRNIKLIITPIAFWGNGYPEKDEKTPSFSTKYGKGRATSTEGAILAQEVYLKQLLQHQNPYTKLNYIDDPDVIAAELNNEPSHSGPKAGVTAYINRLEKAARDAGWNKPLFYNISQSPFYADAVAKSNVNGFSFQWYPTGLVEGHEQLGNFLPNIDQYKIPFDTIPEFIHKAKMVYEFDVADVLQSCMYPAVARSFKQAGFQWVTQFAYDPMATAYANTEYQTHFLNLAYTPAKAISFLIANRVFHQLPKGNYGTYPADSVFGAYRVSYKQAMSEMNSAKEFYYSGNTATIPVNVPALEHLAGVGNSFIVKYQGYGAYFLDKLENGIWRLEVMPDVITVRDPFEKPSPSREAVHIQWENQPMKISLVDIGDAFDIKAINAGNSFQTKANDGAFTIKPGTYLIVKKDKKADKWTGDKMMGTGRLDEFVAPKSFSKELLVVHHPLSEVSAGKALTINAKIVNIGANDKVTLQVNRAFGGPLALPMTKTTPYDYQAVIPEANITPGVLSYHIIIQTSSNEYYSFPGNHKGDPANWDYLNNDNWQTFVATAKGKLVLFDATADKGNANTYSQGFGRGGGVKFAAGDETGKLVMDLAMARAQKNQSMGMQLYIGDKLKGRLSEMGNFTKVVVRARRVSGSAQLRVAITNKDAQTYAAYIDASADMKDIVIPLSAFKPDSSVLVPRPYPGFLPAWFRAASFNQFNILQADKLELTMGTGANQPAGPIEMEVEKAWIEQ